MLDHARKLIDGPEAHDAPDSVGDARVFAQVPRKRIDAPTAAELLPHPRNSANLAPPTKAQKAKRQAAAHLGTFAERYDAWRLAASGWFARLDLAPDLAEDIGSRRWLRGLGTMVGLGAVALAFWPDFTPLEARPAMPQGADVASEMRSQMILPLALGADSGRRMGPTAAVIPLKSAPERPQIQLMVTLAPGDSFASMLRRAGVAAGDIDRAAALVGQAVAVGDIAAGTQMDLLLGRRPAPGAPRPLDSLAFRARFDLELELTRPGAGTIAEDGTPVVPSGPLALKRNIIRVDETPLRVRGVVGSSHYRSMRQAGVPASAVQEYLKALDAQIDMDREVSSADEFDIIIAYRRAATGERQAGQLLYAGIDRSGRPRTQLMRWGSEGRFYEASGVGEQRRGLLAPVPGAVTSNFGMRRHPILGYNRMHAGIDFKARYGTPIVAVSDGRVSAAGRAGGCGIAVRLEHGGGLATRYCHMSQMAVRSGQQVRRGQVIGYVGSTGLSTGAHLHYEMYRGGRAINPASVQFVSRAELSGTELVDFRRQLNRLKEISVGEALKDLAPLPNEVKEPVREIEKAETARSAKPATPL
ncbi:peptidoglycan DD-metalloendopeptidase family protein [Erythromicrobium ramosum]|uniref:Peptidoglycan DD-metalloendopeptidase family protein n=1 Tax=Erythrobacter ramosus TaxID=35811 RepID=A0A6I4UIP9_9SPHN|nr:M23 family metallopeptidase [Erythrobacter ramosus]MXP37664.1 peptidoglycan DD-metalloendopeptidase family protein [Erythrobacter ramosus]